MFVFNHVSEINVRAGGTVVIKSFNLGNLLKKYCALNKQ